MNPNKNDEGTGKQDESTIEQSNYDTNIDSNINNSDDEWVTSGDDDEDKTDDMVSNDQPRNSRYARNTERQSTGGVNSNLGEVFRQRFGNISAISLLQQIFPNCDFSNGIDSSQMEILNAILGQPEPIRNKLTQYNTIDDAVDLIKKSKKIIVLSGAGVSTSAGIPDFRSEDGIYARLRTDFPNLPTPQSMFEIDYFRHDPRPFFKFAKEIYPGQFQPTIGHKFVRCIEEHSQLLRNYTQNIDTLEQVAGIERVINCHGSFATATCTRCKFQVKSDEIKSNILQGILPRCTKCPQESVDGQVSVFKPDIVFFGEGLPDTFHRTLSMDKDECDLLIVIGSSLKVRPVALIPNSVPESVPQILINREPLNHTSDFDIELLGNCDDIIQELCLRLGDTWSKICPPNAQKLTQILTLPPPPIKVSRKQNKPKKNSDCESDVKPGAHQNESYTLKNKSGNDDKVDEKDDKICCSLSASSVIDQADESQCSNARMSDRSSHSSDYEEETSDSEDDLDISIATRLPPNSFLYIEPSRYVFAGAEVTERNVVRYKRLKQNTKNYASTSSNLQGQNAQKKSPGHGSKEIENFPQ